MLSQIRSAWLAGSFNLFFECGPQAACAGAALEIVTSKSGLVSHPVETISNGIKSPFTIWSFDSLIRRLRQRSCLFDFAYGCRDCVPLRLTTS